jgi:protein arginine kinase
VNEKTHLTEEIITHIPWNSKCNPIWPASSFFLRRNLSHHLFPNKLDADHSLQVLQLLKDAFSTLPQSEKFSYLPAEALEAREKEFLAEHFLYQEGWQNASKGQAFIIDTSSRFLAVLNVQDHLMLQWIDCKGEWEKAWNSLNEIEMAVAKAVEYAFSPRFGYLTADPKLCGTALNVSCYLHLPCLIESKQLPTIVLKHKEHSVQATSILSDLENDLVGDFLVLRNRHTLGLAEETILRDLHITATKLILSEQAQRMHYKEAASPEVKDAMARAYGLLTHSYQLQTKETLNAISQIKLGIDLGWITGLLDEEINELFFRCRRAHLQQINHKNYLDKKELAHARAEYLHEKLRQATLAF